jgi:iron uptake system EfeUOB component EfeO/EfeM
MARLLSPLGRGAAVVTVFAAAVIAGLIIFTSTGVGGGTSGGTPSTATMAPEAAVRHLTALQRYSETDGLREGGNASVPGVPALAEEPPTPARRFHGPIAHFRAYTLRQIGRLLPETERLTTAIRSGDRVRARAAWRVAFARYLDLGAVYGALGSLDVAIDGRNGDLHRLERGLWSGASVAGLAPEARRLTADVRRLGRAVPRERIAPLDFVTRAHEVLEDAQRDFMSGADVPWSGEGLLATASGLRATRELIATLGPLLRGKDATDPVKLGLARLGTALAAVHREPGGRLPELRKLTRGERESVDGALSFALERLAAIPGSLETADPVPVPAIGAAR